MLKRIFNVVGWLGMALVAAAVVVRFGMPQKDQYAYYLAWGGLICMLLYTLSQWREIVSVFSRRQARYGTLTGVSVVVVLAILVAINYLGKRQNKRWDLTANQQFSLSDQTKNLVSKLDAPMNVLVFAQEPEFQTYRDKLKEYAYTSKNISVEYIDPDKKRDQAQQNGVQQYGTIVFKYKDRTERITSNTEQDITNAIIKVVSGKQKKVYFTAGHGEKDTASSDRLGYNSITTALQHENYTTDKLVIAQTGSVPDDCDVLVVAGPKNDFLPGEIDAVKKYLDKGGKLLLMLDPPEKADSPPLTNLIALAHDWGMDVGGNVVVDVSGMGQLIGANESMPVAANYPSHPITERFNVMTVYPLTRSVVPVQGGVNGHTAQPVVETSDRSWAEADLQKLYAGKQIGPDDDKNNIKGPVAIASAVSATVSSSDASKPNDADAPKPETRVVVFGDSDFAENAVLGATGNRDLFMNTIGWLSQQENLISIRPKDAADRRLTMTAAQQNNVIVLAMLVIPGLVFGSGFYSWWRRR
jgi:ABC-type uncharacterized transport system involved in gliding motility auxiliary subunit